MTFQCKTALQNMYMTHDWKEAVPSVGPDLQFSIWWVLRNFGLGFQTLWPEMWTKVRVSFDKPEGCQGINCLAALQILCHIISPSLACSCHFSNWTFPCLTPPPPFVVPLIFQQSPSHLKQPCSRGKLLHMGQNNNYEVPVSNDVRLIGLELWLSEGISIWFHERHKLLQLWLVSRYVSRLKSLSTCKLKSFCQIVSFHISNGPSPKFPKR